MTERRSFCATECMVDVFDRAHTMSFTIVAKVRGVLGDEALNAALRALELRHPLLRARIERTQNRPQFVYGEAQPIPLHVQDGPEHSWQEPAARSLDHRVWDDAGPRAELTVIRHDDERSTLLLCLHHVVSDASSGIIAMRDLVRHLNGQPLASPVVHSPGQQHFLPKGHGNARWKARAALGIVRSMLGKKPYRHAHQPTATRHTELARITLEQDAARVLAQRAKRDGATVHGVLCAALATAVARESQRSTVQQRLLHPVDLRRASSAGSQIADAIGYYVSSVNTNHMVATNGPLATLAREITEAVRAAKRRQEELLSAPIQGPWLTARVRGTGDLRGFRDYAEQKVTFNTFGITNLAHLEPLGVSTEPNRVTLEDLFYVTANSVLGALGASASSFAGKLSFTLSWVEPTISRELAHTLLTHVREQLHAYAAGSQSAVQSGAV